MDIDNGYRKKENDGCRSSVDYKKVTRVLKNNGFKFIRNNGQLSNEVMYYTRRGTATYFFAKNKMVFSFLKSNGPEQEVDPVGYDRISPISALQRGTYERLVCSLEFKGCSSRVQIEALDECQDNVNYYWGKDPRKWRLNVPCYQRIIYRNLYPSIDLVCRFNEGNLKYDFIIKPGASLRDVNLAYSGIDDFKLDDEGNMIIETPMGEFTDRKPEGYQEIDGQKVDVGAVFELRKRTGSECIYGFRINKRCNPNLPVVIDPEIIYSSYLGGGGVDAGSGIAVDQNGCVYVTGVTNSPDFPTRNGFDPSYNGNLDAFVTKISRVPAIVYSSYLGGSGSDTGFGIAVDKTGNVIITGETESPDFPTVNAFDAALGGTSDAFVTKISPTGEIVYSTYLGGGGVDSGFGAAADQSGNAYITGITGSADFPLRNAFDNTFGGDRDAFVTKLSPAGALLYSSYLGGSNFDGGLGIAVDQNGNAYITGRTFSTDFPTVNAFDNTRTGVVDAFITKISPVPSIVYSSYLGGSGVNEGNAVAVDLDGNAYITGVTTSNDFPTVNAFQPNWGGDFDAFITKVSPVPAIVYSSYLGGSGVDRGNGVAVDEEGNAYITGLTGSANFPIFNAFDNNLSGAFDAFITKISPAPFIIYSSYLGGSDSENGGSVAVDRRGNVYITGSTTSSDFPVKNGFDRTYGGDQDAFVAKIEAVGQRPECVLTHKVFDSLSKRECDDVFIPESDKKYSSCVFTDMVFRNGVIDEKTLRIAPVPASPDYKYVRFMLIVPCISKYKDYHTGKIMDRYGCLTDIWFEGVLYLPEGRDELKFKLIIETLTKMLDKPQKVRCGSKIKIGLYYEVKSVAKVQLEVVSDGYCITSGNCSIPGKDKYSDFLDPAANSFPTFYPGQQ